MPTTIYLSSGDEFTVTAPYDSVIERWNAGGRMEVTAIWWSDPEAPSFDALSEWPSYRETLITIDLSSAVAVELDDIPTVDAIERARAHLHEQD